MRSEQEMFNLILNYAKSDERVRAVYMNGSRTNPNAVKDKYQDYDIVYVVTETQPFIDDKNWISAFGKPLIVQEPDSNDCAWGEDCDFTRRYAWLMLFDDGNRIDLGIEIKEEAEKNYIEDKLTVLLLDKDNFLPKIPPPTDIDYHVKKPTKEQYKGCCNEFWWCLNNVAKGIARDELPYAMQMYNEIVRNELVHMLEWYIGINTDFSVSAGKLGKYFKKYLPAEIYGIYAATYSDSNYNHFWEAIFAACGLFHTVALSVAEYMGFSYNQSEENGMREYLNMISTEAIT